MVTYKGSHLQLNTAQRKDKELRGTVISELRKDARYTGIPEIKCANEYNHIVEDLTSKKQRDKT